MNSTAFLPIVASRLALALAVILPATAAGADPVGLHPENPHYFLFRGRPNFLTTSGEHYGAVLNRDFDHLPYLAELFAHRFNLTRLFSGTYREVPGSFQIAANTLAPASGHYAAPWARSSEPGAVDGGNKFDLSAWDPDYFDRLRNFVAAAGARGVVVELVLFCPFYEENLWQINPMNARNNVSGIGTMPRTEVFTLGHPAMVAVHESLVRKLVSELHRFDNLYYEICNEPYFGGVALDWQARIARTIGETETKLGGPRHMIAQNIANGSAKVKDPDPAVSLFNFHYATPPDVIALNAGLKRAIGDDETGFRGTGDLAYRTEAWEFMLAGGSVFSNLDYSFTVSHPDGSAPVKPPTPGGGGPTFRKQLTIMRDFLSGFDFVHMVPDRAVIKGGIPDRARARVLVQPGRAYAIYLSGGTHADLMMDLPAGRYRVEWVNPRTGAVDKSQDIDHKGGPAALSSPRYEEDVALRIVARSRGQSLP
jgi:hypothetical protein